MAKLKGLVSQRNSIPFDGKAVVILWYFAQIDG